MADDLKALLDLAAAPEELPLWVQGRVPRHYKRLGVSAEDAFRLAKLGQEKIGAYFGDRLFFTQAMIAGAAFSDEYDEFAIVTPSQYGKSWLVARILLIRAYEGHPEYVACATRQMTEIIMHQMINAIGSAQPELRKALLNRKDQLDRLQTSASKTRLAFAQRGFVEAITLGDTYQDKSRSMAVGRAGDFFIDEAAFLSSETKAEMGRREFAQIGGERYFSFMISNPHNPGWFYEMMIDDDPPENRFTIWMDALTALEEERFTRYQIENSEFARNVHTRRVYLLCELDETADSMFDTPLVYEGEDDTPYKQYFIGVDAAYKGKDDLYVCLASIDEDAFIRIEELEVIDTHDWIDGVTFNDIVRKITRMAKAYGAALVCVDTGWGLWIVSGLEKEGVSVKGVSFAGAPNKARVRNREYASTNAANARAEMHLDLQDLIERGAIAFQKEAYDKVKDILPFVTAKRKEGSGKVQIVSKNEIRMSLGHSPDALDACLLAVHACIEYNGGLEEYII